MYKFWLLSDNAESAASRLMRPHMVNRESNSTAIYLKTFVWSFRWPSILSFFPLPSGSEKNKQLTAE